MSNELTDLLALSHVPRWAIISTSKVQSVAEHSHRVAVILMELGVRMDLILPYSLLVWALVHDGPEAWTGDIPGPFKHPDQSAQDRKVAPWWGPYRDKVPAEWLEFFKIADLIETGTFIAKWGNGPHATYAYERIIYTEVPDQVKKWCIQFSRYGSDAAMPIVTGIIADILSERGRY